MIFMRTLVTYGHVLSRVYCKDLAVTSLCMLLMRFMTDKRTQKLMPVNDIYSPMMIFMIQPTQVTVNEGLNKCLRLNPSLAVQLLFNF